MLIAIQPEKQYRANHKFLQRDKKKEPTLLETYRILNREKCRMLKTLARGGRELAARRLPHEQIEFGSVHGQVEYFSKFPVRDSLFFERVSFLSSDELVMSYGREIPPRNGMTGQAEIITHDMRLLERIYNNLTKELR